VRIARIGIGGSAPGFAVGRGGGWIPLSAVGIEAHTTSDVIASHDRIEAGVAAASDADVTADPEFFSPIVSPTKILAIGFNYLDHIRENKMKEPERPIVFAKFPSSVTDPYGDIVMDDELTKRGDYEVELAVVIGRKTRRIDERHALESVFGYTVANDVSAREWQKADGQFDRSKSFDTFCPIGPWITTGDEVPDPQGLALKAWVNGQLRQDSSTKEMLFGVAHLIHYLARGITLEPGDVILTGTPHGVGFVMDPPRYLAPGDVVECEVEGLGRLRNPVVGPSGA
jgi:5-carboxymethyl-2-hydroxymuconate isomerase